MASTGNLELDGFIAKYSPNTAELTHALFARMRKRLPGAKVLAYDNYNALAIGFGTAETVGSIILSIAAYPRWVSLFFMWGTKLNDPHGLLEGKGNQIRSIPRIGVTTLDDPRVDALIAQAVANADPRYDPEARLGIVIKSISAKQRPRRPA
jgi:hypothetical protein